MIVLKPLSNQYCKVNVIEKCSEEINVSMRIAQATYV